MTAHPHVRTIEWVGDIDGFVRLIDQTLLPTQLAYRDCRSVEEVWEAIKTLRIRGAPAIGVAAAMGAVVGVQTGGDDAKSLGARLASVCDYLGTSRPTAVNLFWALDRMQGRFQHEVQREKKTQLSCAKSFCARLSSSRRKIRPCVGQLALMVPVSCLTAAAC